MSKTTTVGESQITQSTQDVVSVEPVQPDDMPARVPIHWPLHGERQVQEGDRKVKRKFVSVAVPARHESRGSRDVWRKSQTQTGYNDSKEQKA